MSLKSVSSLNATPHFSWKNPRERMLAVALPKSGNARYVIEKNYVFSAQVSY